MRRIDDIGRVKGKVKLAGRVERAISVGHPPSLQEPSTVGRPGMITDHYHSAGVLVVGKHVTHRDGVVPNVIRECEYNVILLQLLERRSRGARIEHVHLINARLSQYLVEHQGGGLVIGIGN